MDRQIVYPGSIPLDTDLLSIQRNVMVALGYLAQATLGNTPIVDGLICSPTNPASLTISISPGSVTLANVIDGSPFGSLAGDTVDPLIKMGVNTFWTPFTLTAPTTSGQSTNYLLQANLLESDATPVVLPFYDAANPSQPFSGPGNNGTGQNTQRLQRVQLQLKPGAPGNAGSQGTPSVDSGWIGLYVISVNYGQTQITAASVTTLPTAPFIPFKLASLTPGFSRMVSFNSSTSFVVPNLVQRVKIRLCGGGGGGGGAPNQGGGGGGAGGYSEGVFAVTPGQSIPVTVGAAGTPGTYAGSVAGNGGISAFGGYISASPGLGGTSAALYSPGGSPGNGYGGAVSITGGYGGDGNAGSNIFPGNGGASSFGGGGRAAANGGNLEQNGMAYGSGGGGCYGISGNGGSGATGVVIVEY